MADIFRLILAGFTTPRPVVRYVLNRSSELSTALLLVLLSHFIAVILHTLTPGVPPAIPPGSIALHFMALLSQIIVFFVLSGLVFFFGKISGGTASRVETQVAIAWHSLLASFLTPATASFMAAFQVDQDPSGRLMVSDEPISGSILVLGLFAVAIWFWLLTQIVTEVHRFKNVWGVFAVLIGLPVAAAFFVATVMGAAALQQ